VTPTENVRHFTGQVSERRGRRSIVIVAHLANVSMIRPNGKAMLRCRYADMGCDLRGRS
jgi:hypothetical protein